MAIVLPEHLMKGKNAGYVRKWLESSVWLKAIFFFPEEAFTPFGAMVKTCLCIIQKKEPGKTPQKEDVFLCEVENLGYDATGRPKAGSEVQDAIREFEMEVAWT